MTRACKGSTSGCAFEGDEKQTAVHEQACHWYFTERALQMQEQMYEQRLLQLERSFTARLENYQRFVFAQLGSLVSQQQEFINSQIEALFPSSARPSSQQQTATTPTTPSSSTKNTSPTPNTSSALTASPSTTPTKDTMQETLENKKNTAAAAAAAMKKPLLVRHDFKNPFGVVVDPLQGNVFVCDTWNDRVQIFDSELRLTKTFGSPGTGNGQFCWPMGITLDRDGNIFVCDTNNHRVQGFDPSGNHQITFGSQGSGPGQFESPRGIAYDPTHCLLFVSDTYNFRIQVFDLSGTLVRILGTPPSPSLSLINPPTAPSSTPPVPSSSASSSSSSSDHK